MMMKTTVQLRHLLQTDFELFDFDYTFDDPLMKERIEQSIIDYYYFHEINGTPDHFKHRFKTRFLQIIDYYNKLHNTTLLEYNPLINHKTTDTLTQTSTSNRQEQNTGKVDSENTQTTENSLLTDEKTSDYPQQPIAGGDYLSGAKQTENTGEENITNNDKTSTESSFNATIADNTNYEKTIEGITGITYQDLIQKERDNLIRLTNMIIEELKPCFLLVY